MVRGEQRATMAAAEPIDEGKSQFTMSFVVATKGLKPGQSARRVLTGAHVLKAAGVCNADILNPKEVVVEASGMPGAGITVVHSLKGQIDPETRLHTPHLLATNNSVYHTDVDATGAPLKAAELFHAKGLGSDVAPTTLKVIPSADQMSTNKKMIHKKIDTKWHGYTTANVLAGVTKGEADVDGNPSHYLVTETDLATGEKSAMWNLLEINRENPKLWGGAYTGAKLDKANHKYKGVPARLMSAAHVEDAAKALTKSLKQHSPFAKGLGVIVTNKGTEVASTNTTVQLTVHRTPLDPVTGLVTTDAPVELSSVHVAGWNGNKSAAKAAAAGEILPALVTESGFGREFPPPLPFLSSLSFFPSAIRSSCRAVPLKTEDSRQLARFAEYVGKKVTAADLESAIKFTPASELPEFQALLAE